MVNNKKGVTLVELLGAIAISSIAIALVASILTSFLIAINAIYSVGNSNTQGMLVSAEVLTNINNFAPDDVEACLVSESCDIKFIKRYEFIGGVIEEVNKEFHLTVTENAGITTFTYGEPASTREVTLRAYTFQSITIILDETFDPIKTVDIRITITDDEKTYDFIISYLMTVNP